MGIAQKREAWSGGRGGRTDVLPPSAPAHPLRTRARVGRARAPFAASVTARPRPLVILVGFRLGSGGGGGGREPATRVGVSDGGWPRACDGGSAFR